MHSKTHSSRRKAGETITANSIGPWKLGRTIGKGSSGRVKIARHCHTGQLAAIKIVRKHGVIGSRISLAKGPEEAARISQSIEREIVIMKLIKHPNILTLYDVWETSNELYLIMEYVEGGELFDYIVSRGRLEVEEALHYFQQVIFAVNYCHRFKVAHRDLKPENILIDRYQNIKVADFGMAAWECGSDLLETSCGSPHYASPEVVEGKQYNGAPSDIWSCGVILHALLAGRLPFDDEDICCLLQKVKLAQFRMPSDIPPDAQDLVRRMLEKDITKRITMPEIVKHPFFLSKPPRSIDAANINPPSKEEIEFALSSVEDIDEDIFANLRTLWRGVSDELLATALIGKEETWEKVVYHLLREYRANQREDSQFLGLADSTAPNRRIYLDDQHQCKPKGRSSASIVNADTPKMLPIFFRKDQQYSSLDRGEEGPRVLDANDSPTLLACNCTAGQGVEANAVKNTGGTEDQSDASSALSDRQDSHVLQHRLVLHDPDEAERPVIQVPEVSDEGVQHFLQQIADRLDHLEGQSPRLNLTSEIRSSERKAPPSIGLGRSIIEDVRRRLSSPKSVAPENRAFGLDVVGTNHPKNVAPSIPVLSQARTLRRKPRKKLVASGKENVSQNTGGGDLRRNGYQPFNPRQRKILGERQIQIKEPQTPISDSEIKQYRKLVTPLPATSGPSLTSDSIGKKNWILNLLTLKPATYNLLSGYDMSTTRSECVRLLEKYGITVITMQTSVKCKLDPMDDAINVLNIDKSLQFRVEFRSATKVQQAAGYASLMILVLEKGNTTSFKSVQSLLRQDWYYDVLKTPASILCTPILNDGQVT